MKTLKMIFDRELCSKALKEPLMFFFLLKGNQEHKIFQMEQKCSQTKFVQNETKNLGEQTLFQIEQRKQKMLAMKIASN